MARGLSPTLVANGLPLGRRGHRKGGADPENRVSDVYEDERVGTKPGCLGFGVTHAGGCVIQKDDRVVELKIPNKRSAKFLSLECWVKFGDVLVS